MRIVLFVVTMLIMVQIGLALPINLAPTQSVQAEPAIVSSDITLLPGKVVEVTCDAGGMIEENQTMAIVSLKEEQPKSINRDTARLMTLGLMVVDWGQTRDLVQNRTSRVELNPMLGPHPSVGQVDTHFAYGMGSYLLLQTILPEKIKDSYNFFCLLLESVCADSNNRTSLKVRF